MSEEDSPFEDIQEHLRDIDEQLRKLDEENKKKKKGE